ncbi:unnamed protein product [Rotaria socialis]|uniref:Inositol polyphosphate-related phosphatase domain-containing protein n=4 Tax=Rotaria socialis TaxID=392032 RepID=A0A820E421_9BILA|nr:unnamed protein product [Rotaria socialis]
MIVISISILFDSKLVHVQPIPFRFRIVTWNAGKSEPDCDAFRHIAFPSVSNNIIVDLIVFGFQEATKTVVGSNSFHKTLKNCLQNENYTAIISGYVGSAILKPIWLYIFASDRIGKSQRVNLLKFKEEYILKVYNGNFLGRITGYKGIIASCIQIDKSINMIFVNMHLPAGKGEKEERCRLWYKFLQEYQSNIIKNDYLFAFGDQNWRTLNILSVEAILEAIKKEEYTTIFNHDELTQMRQKNSTESDTQCLKDFFEAPITFPPTYKYVLNSDAYQIEKDEEVRRPSYTDRILISTFSNDLEIIQYSSIDDVKLSDHRPVFADMILHQRSKNNEMSKNTSTEKTRTTTNHIKTIVKQHILTFLMTIATMTFVCILIFLVMCQLIIKCQTQKTDMQQTAQINIVGTPSSVES